MTVAIEFDISPLIWVKGEIDLSWERALEGLQAFTQQGTRESLEQAASHIHQAQGALVMVGLAGPSLLAQTLENLLLDAQKSEPEHSQERVRVAQQGLDHLRHYLDDLANGQADQPLRLLQPYLDMQRARGQKDASPSDLFFPDTQCRPPARPATFMAPKAELVPELLRRERARFQKGLLQFIRQGAGLAEMRQAVRVVEACQIIPAARTIWWAAMAFFDAQAERGSADVWAKRLCTRIDDLLRRFQAGTQTVPDGLLREVLYQLAITRGGGEHAELVRRTFSLPELDPQATQTVSEPSVPVAVLREVKEALLTTKEDWERYSSGAAIALSQLQHDADQLGEQLQRLSQPLFQQLGQAVAGVLTWLEQHDEHKGDSLGMEVATALLLLEHALSNFEYLKQDDFAAQVQKVVSRLQSFQKGQRLGEYAMPTLDEMSRKAQERLLLRQVVREIQTNLSDIEQALDTFFRNPVKFENLSRLQTPVKQIEGALRILGQDRAVDVLRQCGQLISLFAQGKGGQAQFEAVANKFSALGFFIASMPYGAADIDALLPPDSDELDLSAGMSSTAPAAASAPVAAAPELSEPLPELLAAPETVVAPVPPPVLTVTSSHVSPSFNIQLGLEGGESDAELEDSIPLPPPLVAATAPVSKPQSTVDDSIDAEMLEVFLEEAKEVLLTISQALVQSRQEPSNQSVLTTLRRGFHTLKGSGRMVDLHDLGEAAWSVEQVLNRWLQGNKPGNADLYTFLGHAQSLFSAWVAQLDRGGSTHMDAKTVLEQGAHLLHNDTLPSAAPPVVAEVVPLRTPPSVVPEEEDIPADELLPDEALALPRFSHEHPFSLDELGIEGDEEFGEGLNLPWGHDHPGESAADVAQMLFDITGSDNITLPDPVLCPPKEEEPPTVTIGELSLSRPLYESYLDEAVVLLKTMRGELAPLEDSLGLPPSELCYRSTHTLAGISGTLGFMPLHTLGRAMEDLMEVMLAAEEINVEHLDWLREGLASLEVMFSDVLEQRMPEAQDELVARLLSALRMAKQGPQPVVPEAPTSTAGTVVLLPGDEVDEQLLPIFLDESLDIARDIDAASKLWQQQPENSDHAAALARALHTLKGGARMAGLMNLGELVHELESSVSDASSRGVSPEFFARYAEQLDQINLILDALRRGERTMAPAPSATPAVADTTAETGEAQAQSAQATLRVRAQLVDQLVNQAGEMSIARTRVEGEVRALRQSLSDLTENVVRLKKQIREIEIQAESQMQSRHAYSDGRHSEFDPLEFDRFTRFQELTRMMAESVNDVGTIQNNLLKSLDEADTALINQGRLNKDLAQSLMSVRMVPFSSLASRLHRLVRQISKELGKKANLEIRGGHVELDRSVLERMSAPLEHLIRNAISHGIESPAQRQRAGKHEIGEITLTVAQRGNEVNLELADDGAGLDYSRIRRRAEEAGLLEAGADVDEAALTALIFQSGFSTADKLSNVAGRGVGMDVVRNEATALGGRIDVTSTPGHGSQFHIFLPLTLAVTQAVILKVGSRSFALPSAMVEQAREVKPEHLAQLQQEGGVDWMGARYPYHFLARLLGDAMSQPASDVHHTWLLLLRSGSRRIALHVDDLRGNQEIVVKNVGPQLARVAGITGATVLGDGDVVLIINPVALAARELTPMARRFMQTPALSSNEPEKTSDVATVMVVDDSLTVRKITSRLLEREGYRVVTAKDGEDALEKLLDVTPDAMLVDIEMPRMDGFDLCRNIRADARLKAVPIIMITSRTAEKHRTYAKEIGVNHYLGKPFQEDELLGLLRGYTE